MYFADLDPTNGSLHALKLVPLQIKNFRLSIPSWRDIEMGDVSSSEQGSFLIPNGSLSLSGLGQGPNFGHNTSRGPLLAQSGHSLDTATGYFDTAFCFSATDLLVS